MSYESIEIGRLYVPIKQIADVLSASQKDLFVGLPGLTGYFPMSIVDTAAKAVNHSQAGLDLTQTGVCPIGYDGNSYRHTGDGVNYLSSSLDYALTGLETYIEAAFRGFTLGGWFRIETTPSGSSGLISKDGSAPQRGYSLYWNSSNEARFLMSSNGSSTSVAISASSVTAQWHFIAARFIPSTEVAVFLDGIKSANTTAIPASCNVSTQAFEVGRGFASDASIIHARHRDVFVCRTALSDALIEEVRQASLPG